MPLERKDTEMDVNVITELISNVAFPIAAFVMMFYYSTKTVEDMRKTIEENTLIMTKVVEKLDSLDQEG